MADSITQPTQAAPALRERTQTGAQATPTRPLRVGYVSVLDPRDVTKWSGTAYHMWRSLEDAGAHVELIGPLRHQYNPINIARHLWNKKVRGLNDHPHRDAGNLQHYARQVEQQLEHLDVDVIVGPGGLPLAHLRTDIPVAVWTDCTFASLENYYEAFKNLSARTVRDGHAADQALFDRCKMVLMSSQWAADSAVNDYGFDPSNVHIAPLGANVPRERHEESEIARVIDARSNDELRLLFLGVQWVRKGGDHALAVAEELHRRGLPVKLQLVGALPDDGRTLPDYVEPLGFISKGTPEGMERIANLLDDSHMMVLPTRADCTPIVFNEASSAGLPVMTTHTGGVGSVVRGGVNGTLFDLDAPASAWADEIERLWNDRAAYRTMCLSAWRDYGARLNWRASGAHALSLLERLRDESSRKGRAAAELEIKAD